MIEPKVQWGMRIRKFDGGMSLGASFNIEDVNGEVAVYLSLGLATHYIIIGRIW